MVAPPDDSPGNCASDATVSFTHRPFDALSLIELHDVLRLRLDVFVGEQRVTIEPEVDGLDPTAIHVLGTQPGDGALIATARLRFDRDPVKVERIAVRSDRRSLGVGRALMAYVHEVLAGRAATMSAQAHLEAWYGAQGWVPSGEVYDEAGIPHVRMDRPGPGTG